MKTPPELLSLKEKAEGQNKRVPSDAALELASKVLELFSSFLPNQIVAEADGGIRMIWDTLAGEAHIICDNDKDILIASHRPCGMKVPVTVAKKPWEQDHWLDKNGKCWFYSSGWFYREPTEDCSEFTHSLPYWGIELPKNET
jgi:hypothetical protein